jgi:hypothetical protein
MKRRKDASRVQARAVKAAVQRDDGHDDDARQTRRMMLMRERKKILKQGVRTCVQAEWAVARNFWVWRWIRHQAVVGNAWRF